MVPDAALALLGDGVGRGLRLGLRARLDRAAAAGLLLLIHRGEWETSFLIFGKSNLRKSFRFPLKLQRGHLISPRSTWIHQDSPRTSSLSDPVFLHRLLATLLRPLLA